MSPHLGRLRSRTWLALGCAVWTVTAAAAAARSPAVPLGRATAAAPVALAHGFAQSPTPAAQIPLEYIGQETCLGCHVTHAQTYEDTPHGRAIDPRSPAGARGCESCHGPGSRHIDDPTEISPPMPFRGMAAAEASAACTACHSRGDHALWDGSAHESRDVSCVSCHSAHGFESDTKMLTAATQTDLCASCHREKVAKIDRSGHMPVREGKMECATCHNVHGTTNVRLLRAGDSIGESCTSCHADKRGPFLWEHAPSRDGCVTCHDPHGSSNERMLVTRAPILCQRCHVGTRHPSTIYDSGLVATSARVFARSCVTCHAAIHGSNHPSGQRFVR